MTALIPLLCVGPLLVFAIVGTVVDRMNGFYAGWDPDKDWSTRGAPWQRAKRRAYRDSRRPAGQRVAAHRAGQAHPSLTPGQWERLAIAREFLGDPTYMPYRPEDR